MCLLAGETREAFERVGRLAAEIRSRCDALTVNARAERRRLAVQREAMAKLRLMLAALREQLARERQGLSQGQA
jgi:hypothetical protein